MTNVTDIPSALGAENRAYLERAFTGYVNPPRKVIAYVVDGTEKTLDDALAYFATQQFDYLVGAPDTESADAQKIASWVKSERANKHTVKAVLPGTAADSRGSRELYDRRHSARGGFGDDGGLLFPHRGPHRRDADDDLLHLRAARGGIRRDAAHQGTARYGDR